jgi:hypothetical protein
VPYTTARCGIGLLATTLAPLPLAPRMLLGSAGTGMCARPRAPPAGVAGRDAECRGDASATAGSGTGTTTGSAVGAALDTTVPEDAVSDGGDSADAAVPLPSLAA